MHEIAKVTLQNEMDLILAHKRSMKLAEIAGLSLAAQTTFATAVSEVARNTIESGKKGCLILNVEADQRDKYIVACIKDEQEYTDKSLEGLEYAKRLVNKYNVSTKGKETSIELFYYIAPSFKIDIHKLDEWRNFFRNEPPISAYEELKRKNEQLQDLSEKVQKSEAQYKTLTNALPLLIFSVDKEGKVVYANEWLSRYSGETIDSLNRNSWRKLVYDEDYASFSVVLNSNITSGTTALKTQVRLVNKDGEPLWHQLSLVPLLTENTEPVYWIGYMADIHAQKVVEETLKDNFVLKQTQKQLKENQHTLEQYIEELARSNQELQQFAFVASHDLQEPVRKFIFYSDFLLSQMDEIPKERAVESLKTIQRSAIRMRTLIRDLLVFSQIKKEATKFAPVDLAKIATDAVQDFEMAIQEKKAELVIESLPVINADERMMGQLFENLISNSLKYARENEAPKITISHQQLDNRIELAFEDNGIGFDEKYLPQMFTLFQRLHDRTVYEGTGLGLAICKKIVDLHQGRIWACSEEGKGATFFVSLPLNNVSNKL
jgi:PAS domain S-box-containing protein